MSIKMVLINSALRILQVPHTPNNRRSNGLVSPKWTNMKIYMEITSSITTKLQRFPKISKDLLFLFATKKMARKKVATWGHHVAAFSAAKVESGSWWPWEAKPVGWKVARISMPGEYLFIGNNIYIYFMYVIIYCILYVYINGIYSVYLLQYQIIYTYHIYVCKYTDVFFHSFQVVLENIQKWFGPICSPTSLKLILPALLPLR